jgi:hypothetical protein
MFYLFNDVQMTEIQTAEPKVSAYCLQGSNGYWKVEKIQMMSYLLNSGKNDPRGR